MNRLLVLILLVGVAPCLAQVRTGENSGGDASQQSSAPTPSGQLDFQTDLFTGRFGYEVAMQPAPGRHGSAPSIALRYTSSTDNGWCGVGWELDLGYVQRETKRGVPVVWSGGVPQKAYDDSKGFVFSLNGQSSSLVHVGDDEYRAEIEGSFLRFQFLTNANQWQVTDKSGNSYFFGQTSASRMSNTDTGWSPNAWNGTFRWAISHVESVLGDTTDYSYTNTFGKLYPTGIGYNGHTSGKTNTHTIDFILGTRSEYGRSYRSGYAVWESLQLDAVVNKVSGQVVWSNRLSYALSPSTYRTLLKSVTRFGTNLTASLPPTTFDYAQQEFGFQSGVNWTNLSIPTDGYPEWYELSASSGDLQFLDLLDMDGDALPDRVFQQKYSPYTNLWVQRNNGSGFGSPSAFGPHDIQTYTDGVVGTLSTSNDPNWTVLNSVSMRLLDINGDSLPDRVQDPLESYSDVTGYAYTNLVVQLNGGTNWAGFADVRWTNVLGTNFVTGDPQETSYRAVEMDGRLTMLDMNGDGLPDRVMARQYGPFTNLWVQFNTGSGFTDKQAFGGLNYDTYTPGGYRGSLSGNALRMFDINGDSLPDRVMYPTNSTGTPESDSAQITYLVVEFNNGYGFEPAEAWTGLFSWYQNSLAYHFPEGTVPFIQDHEDRAYRDINGDGLPDRVIRYWEVGGAPAQLQTNWLVQINTGTSFAYPVLYGPYYSQGHYSSDFTAVHGQHARLTDINGDGLPDHLMRSYSIGGTNLHYAVELAKGPFPDLLNVVSNGIGGSITVAYKPSTRYDNRESTTGNSRKLLPFPVYTVSSLSVADGLYPSNTTTYAYEGGMWNPSRREFNGFATVEVTDPLGLTQVHWFHQAGGRDNSAFGEYLDTAGSIGKRGMLFRVETFGTNGALFNVMLNKVDEAVLSGGRHFAFIDQTLAIDYPAGNTNAYRATARQFAYDPNTGNLTNTTDLGEVTNVVQSTHAFSDVGSDAAYQFTAFAALSNTNILDKPERATLTTDANGEDILRESLFGYDGDTGNLVLRRDRICEGSYRTNSFGYDTYGNLTVTTNPVGIVTTTVYDSTYQTFPASQTVGGSFISTFTHDSRSGALLTSVDPKGLVTSNAYDNFLRLTATSISSAPNGSANVWKTRIDYNLGGMNGGVSANSVRLRQNDGVDATNGHETWTYADGLGRQLQSRVESETNGFRVSDTIYNARGDVRFVTHSYFSSGTTYSAPSGTKPGIHSQFDPIARPIKVSPADNGSFSAGKLTGVSASTGDTGSPLGPTLTGYEDGNDPWALVLSDPENKIHKYLLDAFGRTNQIVEVTGAGNCTSTLRYDPAGSLTNQIDALNNTIHYAYNDLGELVAMSDPNMGRWDYIRDFAGRVRQQIDGNSNATYFVYSDPLGRLTERLVYDYTGAFQFGITNVYDTGETGYTVYPGQLFATYDEEGWLKHSYDVRGRILKTARYLSKTGQTYTNQFSFDDADHVRTQTYPASLLTVTNAFDTGMNLASVKQLGGAATEFYHSRGFNEFGQSRGADFGNGAVTTNDYWSSSKRLKALVTRKGSEVIQSLSYQYDRTGNITNIVDGVYTNTDSAALTAAYDDLHRLTSLTRPAIGQSVAWQYNTIGNIASNGEWGFTHTYSYGSRMPQAVKGAGANSYAYDGSGNMLARAGQNLVYDAANRLKWVSSSDVILAEFGYAFDSARLWKESGTNLQVWIGNDYEEKQSKQLCHIFAGNQRVATFNAAGTLESGTNTTTLYYYHGDHLGSSSVLTDANGNRVEHYEYSAFGRERFNDAAQSFPVTTRFTGQPLDEETGLYYYGFRYYDPELARFIQPDPIIPDIGNPQSWNRYTYTLNNPLKYTDPSGHEPWYSYIPGIGPGIAEYQGNQALNAMAVRLGEQHGTDWASYNEARADLFGNATAGNVSGIAGVAKIAGGTTDLYTTVAQEIATAGVATPVVKVAANRMGEAPGFFSRLFSREAKNFTSELELGQRAARRHLAAAMEGTGGQAHHIIPWEMRGNELVKRAAEGGFNINGAENGIRLGSDIHFGPHAKYNAAVESKLNSIFRANPNIAPKDAAQAVRGYADQLRAGIQRTETKLK